MLDICIEEVKSLELSHCYITEGKGNNNENVTIVNLLFAIDDIEYTIFLLENYIEIHRIVGDYRKYKSYNKSEINFSDLIASIEDNLGAIVPTSVWD